MASASINYFSYLRVENLSDDDENSVKITEQSKDNKGSVQSANSKKRARRRKKQQQEKAEFRDIAFGKPSSKVSSVSHQQQHHQSEPLSSSNQIRHSNGAPSPSPSPKLPPPVISVKTQDWDSWKERDDGLTEDKFEKDLYEAILQSQLDHEHQQKFVSAVQDVEDIQQPHLNKKERRKLPHGQGKEKAHAMSLQAFQKTSDDTSTQIDNTQVPQQPEPDPLFFGKIKDDATKIIKKEHNKKMIKKNQKQVSDNALRLQYEDDMEKKGDEVDSLHKEIVRLKEELAQVKKRNKQLCFILAQGEMKDKAEVLKHVEEITTVKDELTEEVIQLHASLEQERSKVHSLQSEIKRLQEKKK